MMARKTADSMAFNSFPLPCPEMSGSCDLRKHAGVTRQAVARHLGIGRVQLDQDGVALEPISDKASRASAAKWVKHGFSSWTSGKDARFDQRRREGGEVSVCERLRGYSPDASLVSAFEAASLPGFLLRCGKTRLRP